MVVAAADVPLESSGAGAAAVSSRRRPMTRRAFPLAPHQFFHRNRIPAAAPHEMMKQAPAPEPAPALPADNEDLRLSDLEQVCHLGEGACGVVTKVRHRITGTEFALKTAHYADPRRASDDEETEALRRCATAGSPSPHVVRCHAVLRGAGAGGQPAYVLELMDAGTLSDILARRGGRGFPEGALAEVAARCLEGLAHVHARGVAHLDLRPDNLLASSSGGDVKIGDFSVSRVLYGPAGEPLRVSVSVGSHMYLSPERFEPDARAGPLGAMAADVWAFGVTVLELFLGRCPFLPPDGKRRPSFQKLRKAIWEGEPPSVPESAAASPELRGFVAACLQKDPRRRATVAQLLAHPFVSQRHVDESRRALHELILETME